MMKNFPTDFIWGAATAGHQIEGNNSNSDVWFLEHVEPTVYSEPSALGCDSYNRWCEDIDLVVSLNLKAYRFSIEWARIQPNQGEFSALELAHYEAIIDYCHEVGVKPILTLNHFTTPHWFAKLGGWFNPGSAQLFANFTGQVMERFGEKLEYVLTLNEPDLPRLLTFLDLPAFIGLQTKEMLDAASAKAGVEKYRVATNVLDEELDDLEQGLSNAHKAARETIRKVSPNVKIGFSIAMSDDRAIEGGELLRDSKREALYQKWFDLAQEDDFFAVQNYDSSTYGPSGPVELDPTGPRNGFGGLIDPTSLAGAVRYAFEKTGKPIFVTENGLGLIQESDALRSKFLRETLAHLQNEIESGTDVFGYCVWSLLDNYEWMSGYSSHFGIVSVDRETFQRTPKPSAFALAEIALQNSAAELSS